eukprot:7703034-Alexandrium_andersonii.AAC.1
MEPSAQLPEANTLQQRPPSLLHCSSSRSPSCTASLGFTAPGRDHALTQSMRPSEAGNPTPK